MKKFVIPLSFAVMALIGAEARANQPLKGTLDVALANPIGSTFPFRVTGTLTTVGQVTGGGRFLWNMEAGSVTGVLVVKDVDGDTIQFVFGGPVTPEGVLQSAGFEILGGTGKWEGVSGIGALGGSVAEPASFDLRGTIFE